METWGALFLWPWQTTGTMATPALTENSMLSSSRPKFYVLIYQVYDSKNDYLHNNVAYRNEVILCLL